MQRSEWMKVLALSHIGELIRVWSELPREPAFEWVRQPELVTVMAGGQICGEQNFNLGEVAVTRCVVRLIDEPGIGVAYVVGRSRRHATLAALLDALAQKGDADGMLARSLIADLKDIIAQREARIRTEVASTAVDFDMLLRS